MRSSSAACHRPGRQGSCPEGELVSRLAQRGGPVLTPDEIDRDGAGLALAVFDRQGFAVARLKLVEQRQWIVIVDEAHGLARMQRIERAEDRGVAKALGDAARVERVDRIRGEVSVNLGHEEKVFQVDGRR